MSRRSRPYTDRYPEYTDPWWVFPLIILGVLAFVALIVILAASPQ